MVSRWSPKPDFGVRFLADSFLVGLKLINKGGI